MEILVLETVTIHTDACLHLDCVLRLTIPSMICISDNMICMSTVEIRFLQSYPQGIGYLRIASFILKPLRHAYAC